MWNFVDPLGHECQRLRQVGQVRNAELSGTVSASALGGGLAPTDGTLFPFVHIVSTPKGKVIRAMCQALKSRAFHGIAHITAD